MKMYQKFLFSYYCILLLVAVEVQSQNPPWSYDYGAPNGPYDWYKLPGYATCNGKAQSPIALNVQYTKSISRPVTFTNYDNYLARNVTIVNDGHTVDIEFTYVDSNLANIPYISGGLLTGKYKLIGFHFHWGSSSSKGSEHTINSQRFPMEGHFVHIKSQYADLTTALRDKEGVAVIGYMFTISQRDNYNLTPLLKYFQYVKYKDQSAEIAAPDPFINDLLPNTYRRPFFTYKGSLTIPPCSESVIWIVYTSTVSISENQIEYFRKLKETAAYDRNSIPLVNNFRNLQSLNGRPVYYYYPY